MRSFPLFSALGSGSSSIARTGLMLGVDECVELTGFLRALVQTPSLSAQEGTVAEMIRQQLRTVGVHDIRTDRAGNVIARLGNGQGPTLLVDAHMDTVSPAGAAWPFGPYSATIRDGVLYGLGACDMKASIAAMVYSAKRLVEGHVGLHGNLILAFVVQEEPCEGCALKVLVEQEGIRPDWVVLAEPSDLTIKRGHRGRVLFKVTVHGKSSHGSRPDLGENAIMAAARLIFGIDLLAGGLASDPFLGAGTIAVTHIESKAASANAIPDLCTFYVDRRLTLGETATRAQTQIESVIEREGINATVEVVEYRTKTYTGYPLQARESFNPWALDPEHPLLAALSQVVQTVLGQPAPVGNWAFSTDGVYSMAEASIPTVGFGPGNPDYAHMVDEHVHLDDVVLAAHIYALLASVLLGRPA
jgi:putative selenium metabolism hydrolase